MKLTYAVVGTGALGGFYGGLLAKAGHKVEFLIRSDYEYVKHNGLRVDSVLGDFHIHNLSLFKNTEEMAPCDVVLVCLKTTQNELLKTILPPLLKPDTVVVLLQNGLGVEADLAIEFPRLNVAGGVAFICSQKAGPGHIRHLDLGKIEIGLHCGDRTDIVSQVCEDLTHAGVSASVCVDLMYTRWRKLIWNIPFNGMAVVMNASTDQLIRHPATRPLIYDLMRDVVNGANAMGVALDEATARKMVDMTENMTPYEPSMKLDYEHQRPLEVKYIYSRPIEMARAAGYEMTHVEMLERQLLFLSK